MELTAVQQDVWSGEAIATAAIEGEQRACEVEGWRRVQARLRAAGGARGAGQGVRLLRQKIGGDACGQHHHQQSGNDGHPALAGRMPEEIGG